MKAMILAAGLGNRMRPLTSHTPKALLAVQGQPLIVYHLQKLAQAGIYDVVINVHHHAEKIQNFLGDGRQFNVNITYSIENELLETGGGIYNSLHLLGAEPFIVVSADIFTDYSFTNLFGKISTQLAHLVLVPNPDFHPTGDFAMQSDHFHGKLNSLTQASNNKFTFGNIGIYHPDLFKLFYPHETKFFRMGSLLALAMAENLITGEVYQGFWDNLGTMEQLEKLNKKLKAINH